MFEGLIQQQIDLAWQQRHSPRHAGDVRANLKRRLAAAQQWRCSCCGGLMSGCGTQPTAPALTYLVPPSSGGSKTDETNITITCLACNQDHQEAPPEMRLAILCAARANA